MKKIVSILFASIIFTTSAYAGGLIGLKVGNGDLEGTKLKTGNTVAPHDAQTSGSRNNEFGAIFAEVNVNDGPVNLGFELVPLSGTLSAVNDDSDASVEVSNLTTIYALAAREIGGGSVYAKVGYSHADIDNAKQSNGTTTINSFSDSLEGPMLGIGFQSAEFGNGLVFRAEGTYSEFDDVEVKTTDADGLVETKKATDIDLTTLTISVAKTF
jgi:hypothetical protein